MNVFPSRIVLDDEARRLEAVRRYDVLDTPPDGAFDRITAIAARRFNVPISLISIVDQDRIWLKSHYGVEIDELAKDPGLCSTAILSSGPYILTDASKDPRSCNNPLVAGTFGLRFYAGVPLATHDGLHLGSLSVIDKKPRQVSQDQIDELCDLANIVMDEMELRLSARAAIAHVRLMAKEIDHRVVNSLQFIVSMLAIQSRSPDLGGSAIQLQMAANRVAAVAQVHRHFYAEEAREISALIFLRRLCDDLSSILNRTVDVQGDGSLVPTTAIQPIGLIVNELVTNAAKYGAGMITVRYHAEGPVRVLSIADEGEGLPAGFDMAAGHGLGMKLSRALGRQLGGELQAGGNPAGKGACFTLAFPI